MTRAVNKSKPTSPGIDVICYVKLKHIGKELYQSCCNFITKYGKREGYQVHGKRQ